MVDAFQNRDGARVVKETAPRRKDCHVDGSHGDAVVAAAILDRQRFPREGHAMTDSMRFGPYRWVRRLVSVVAAGLLLATGTYALAPAYARDSPADRTFKSRDEAAEAGAIDANTVTALRKGKYVQAFAILEGDKVADVYGSGDKDGVAQAATLVKEIRDTVLAAGHRVVHDTTARAAAALPATQLAHDRYGATAGPGLGRDRLAARADDPRPTAPLFLRPADRRQRSRLAAEAHRISCAAPSMSATNATTSSGTGWFRPCGPTSPPRRALPSPTIGAERSPCPATGAWRSILIGRRAWAGPAATPDTVWAPRPCPVGPWPTSR